jgi:hypothetical protein
MIALAPGNTNAPGAGQTVRRFFVDIDVFIHGSNGVYSPKYRKMFLGSGHLLDKSPTTETGTHSTKKKELTKMGASLHQYTTWKSSFANSLQKWPRKFPKLEPPDNSSTGKKVVGLEHGLSRKNGQF